MKGKRGGPGIGFDPVSKLKGIWKKSSCKGVCELLIVREISWQVLGWGSLLGLLCVLTGRNASSKVLHLRLIYPVSSQDAFPACSTVNQPMGTKSQLECWELESRTGNGMGFLGQPVLLGSSSPPSLSRQVNHQGDKKTALELPYNIA